MVDTAFFHTERLKLRLVKPIDFQSVYKWENDKTNWRQSGATENYSEYDIRQYVSKSEDLFKDGQTRYIVEDLYHNTIGCVDLFDFEKESNVSSVGVLIDNEYQLKGYAAEALECLCLISKSVYKISALKAFVLSDNHVSIKLFKKKGFVLDETKTTKYTYLGKDYLRLLFYKKL